MTRFVVQRITALIVILFVASWLIFLLPYLTGVDPTMSIIRARVGERVIQPEAIESLRQELGLDKALLGQYQDWISHLLRGDLGFSFISRSPINELLWRGFKVTIVLSSAAVLLALLISVPLGIWAAHNHGGNYSRNRLDNIISFASQTGIALPEYWVAPMLILLFSLQLGWLPSAGWRGPLFLVMPVVTLALRPIAYFTSLVRQAMIEVLASDYVRTARAKGLSLNAVLFKHALRNAFLPVLTMSSLWFASLLGGSVIVEVIFAIPGMGRLIYDAVLANDLPLLQGSLMILVALTTVIMTFTDILYKVLNPTIQIDSRDF